MAVIMSYPRSGSTWLRWMITTYYTKRQTKFDEVNLAVPKFGLKGTTPFRKTHAATIDYDGEIIYLIRDGRDVVVSYYHYNKAFLGYEGTFEEYAKSEIAGHGWPDHVNKWLRPEYRKHRILISYEKHMLPCPAQTLAAVLLFSGLDLDRDRVEAATKLSSFSNMKAVEKELGCGLDSNYADSHFCRSGRDGGWRDFRGVFDTLLDDYWKDTLKKAGYDV